MAVLAAKKLFASIGRIFECRCGLFVDWILARIPFGHHSLLFKSRKLTTIMNGREKFPKQQHCQSNEDNCCDHSKNNSKKENFRWTFRMLLSTNMDCDGSIGCDGLIVHELITTIVFIVEGTEMRVLLFIVVNIFDTDRHKKSTILSTFVGILQRSFLVLLTFDAVFELVAAARTCWAFVAVETSKSDAFIDVAFTLSANTFTVVGANFSVRSSTVCQ